MKARRQLGLKLQTAAATTLAGHVCPAHCKAVAEPMNRSRASAACPARPRWTAALAWLAAWMLCAWGPLVRAAEAEPAVPPARVGQLSFIGGAARVLLDPAIGWQPAELNLPIGARAALATEPASRLEVRIGSLGLWLAPDSQVGMSDLDDGNTVAELAHGRLVLRLRTPAAGERLAVTAEGARFVIESAGAFRAEFDARRHRFTVHVQDGSARLVLGTQELVLKENQWAAADARMQVVLEQGSGDTRVPLDDFAERRDRRNERASATGRLPPDLTGAAALDGHGSWRTDPVYGAVWYPDNLPPDWAPYRYGHWRWVAPWGWTWIDDASWGFAPSHYGRWLFLAGRWGWAPGSFGAATTPRRPIYAPALVGFYGSAEGAPWTYSAAAPAVVGWYPLAPGEVYWPAYAASLNYVRALNAPSVPDAAQIRGLPDAAALGPAHRFARTSFAATAVPETVFRGMQAVAANQIAMPPAALAQAPLSGRRAPPPPQARDAAAAAEGGPGQNGPARALAPDTQAARNPSVGPSHEHKRERPVKLPRRARREPAARD